MKSSDKKILLIVAIIIATNVATALLVINLKDQQQAKIAKADKSGTVVIKDVDSAFSKTSPYDGKTVSITGKIIKNGSDYYIVTAAPKSKTATAIKLDFSTTSVDPSALITDGQSSSAVQSKNDHTVTGKLIQQINKPPQIEVVSVK